MKKKIIAVVLLVSILFSIASCSKEDNSSNTKTQENAADTEEPANGGTLIMASPTDVQVLNRMFEGYKEGTIMMSPIYDELYYTDMDGTRYYLAESADLSEDKLTVTVKLRDNMKWHDGEAITADDLIYTMDVSLEEENASSYASNLQVNGVNVTYSKVDDLTVEIYLPEPSSAFVPIFGNITLIPEHVFEGELVINTSEKNNLGIGSGPYKVKEWKKDQYLELERFDDYYGGTPSLDEVIFKIIPDQNAQQIAFENGEINLLEITDATMYDKYSNSSDATIYSFVEGRVNYFTINQFSENFQDQKAKEAIYSAIDIDEIIQGAYGSENIATAANSFFSPVSDFYDSMIENYEYDPELAAQLAKETGLTEKKLTLYFNANRSFMKETALTIQEQLKEIGVELEIIPLESSGFFTKVFSEDADYDFYLNGYTANGLPNVFSGWNDARLGKNSYVTEEEINLWQEGTKTFDDDERQEIYSQLQAQFKEDLTMYPLAYTNFNFVAYNNIHGLDEITTIPIFEDYMKISMSE